MNIDIEMIYQYSLIFFRAMIAVTLLFLLLLLIKAYKLSKQASTLKPQTDSIIRNTELSRKKIKLVREKTNRDFKKIRSILKYGFLAKVILDDFSREEKKSLTSLAKSTGKTISRQNDQKMMKQLRRNFHSSNK